DAEGAAVEGQQAGAEEASVDKPICRRSDGAGSDGTGGGLPGAPEGCDHRVREPAFTRVAQPAGHRRSTSCCALICETCASICTARRWTCAGSATALPHWCAA